jgi:hypothetical protein
LNSGAGDGVVECDEYEVAGEWALMRLKELVEPAEPMDIIEPVDPTESME